MLFKELIEQIKELIEQIDEICQIRQIRQRVEDLSGKRKELCRRSFMIQSEEIKNDIIELRKNLVNKKRKIKNKQKGIEKEVNKLEKDLNDLVLSDSKLYKKSYLENLYFISAIVLGSIPIMSLLGFVLLFFYLKDINASIYFLEIASSGGIWFSFVTGAVIFIFFFLCPIVILGLESSKNKDDIGFQLFSDNIVIFFFSFVLSPCLSFIGFSFFFDKYENFILVLVLIWHVFIFFIFLVYKNNKINLNIILVLLPVFWVIMMSGALPFSSRLSIDFSLKNVFKIIEFNQKNYSWFKVNNTYFERTGLDIGNLKVREGNFSSQHHIHIARNNNDVFLYGRLWINSTKIKILCPPKSFNEKGEPTDIEAEDVGKCLHFQEGDLQNLTGLISSYSLKK